jgi:hypothetical protein
VAHLFGRVLIALSLSSIAFASLRFVCGVMHAVLGVRDEWIYALPHISAAAWGVAQLAILVAWVPFWWGVLRKMRASEIDPRGEVSPLFIAWLPLALASVFTFGLAFEATHCGSCGCAMHDHTWGDALFIVAASFLPVQRVLLVRAILRRMPKPKHFRMRGDGPTSA